LAATGGAAAAARVAGADERVARRLALAVRLGLGRAEWGPLPLPGPPLAVRSSALLEDGAPLSAAGQFESFLGLADPAEVAAAVRACWASLWSSRALAYLRARGRDPAATAMAVLIQRLVPARAAGGALSRTPDGGMLLTAAWGLGATIAHGEVVPDRVRLDAAGEVVAIEPGIKDRCLTWTPAGVRARAVPAAQVRAPCLTAGEAAALARLVQRAAAVLATPVEVEWALGDDGPALLQARPLRMAAAEAPIPDAADDMTGHPSGIGRGSGPARVVRREAELARVGPGDVLVTRVAGPVLAAVLGRVAGV